MCTDIILYFRKSHVCPVMQEYIFLMFRVFMYCRCLWSDGHCGLWILVNTSHYFSHVERFIISHISINYPLLEFGNGMLDVAVLYSKHFRNCPLEILKLKFEESWVHISFFQVPYICYVTLPIIMMEPNACLIVVCYNNCFGPCL